MTERHFKIEVDDFSVEVVLGGEWMLYDFAAFIIEAVGFDFDHCFEFCDNLKDPHRSSERYTLFADIGEEADDSGVQYTSVSQIFYPGRRMIFLFDYGDDWFFRVTCTAMKESRAKRRFRKVLSTRGAPPEQYPVIVED